MFDLKRPCVNCPFRKGVGETFAMSRLRLWEIFNATAFQCHKTIDYSGDKPASADKPQQCAGLMAVLHRDGVSNSIMQVGERFGHFDPRKLDPDKEAYPSRRAVLKAHGAWSKAAAGE